ncbi:hypothetical protein NV64_03835 [Erwinia sp. B116]|nr:hypothetical protein NV64_03835 [Erwinia sp. B116]
MQTGRGCGAQGELAHCNALDLELAREVAGYFRINQKEANAIIASFCGIVSQWRTIADTLHLQPRQQEQMADAFRVAER